MMVDEIKSEKVQGESRETDVFRKALALLE